MATSSKERDISECPVCIEVYVKPQKLDCDHSLCESCLNRLDFDGIVKCPLCNKVCARIHIKPDFRLQQFIDILKEKQFVKKQSLEHDLIDLDGKYICQMCEMSNLAFWCVECKMWLCETCIKNHTKLRDLKKHRFVSFCDKLAQERTALKSSIKEKEAVLNSLKDLNKKRKGKGKGIRRNEASCNRQV